MDSASRTLEGDYDRAWVHVVDALARVPNLAVDGASRDEGVIRAVRKKLLGRVDVTIRLTETETGEVEVAIEARGSGISDAGGVVSAIVAALPAR